MKRNLGFIFFFGISVEGTDLDLSPVPPYFFLGFEITPQQMKLPLTAASATTAAFAGIRARVWARITVDIAVVFVARVWPGGVARSAAIQTGDHQDQDQKTRNLFHESHNQIPPNSYEWLITGHHLYLRTSFQLFFTGFSNSF